MLSTAGLRLCCLVGQRGAECDSLGLGRRAAVVMEMTFSVVVSQKNFARCAVREVGGAIELQEILIQALPYVGFPAIAEAMTATIEVLREHGMDGGTKTAQENKTL